MSIETNMSITQETYPDRVSVAYNGQRLQENSSDVRPYIVETNTIPIGRACRQGSGARNALLGIVTNGFVGVSVRSRFYGPENADTDGNLEYPVGQGVNLLYRGGIWVEVGDPVVFGTNVVGDLVTGELSSRPASGYILSGGAHATLTALQAVTDGSFSISGNDVTGLDFSTAANLAGVASVVQAAIRALTTITGYATATVTYANSAFGATFPEGAPVTLFATHTSGTGTDVSGLLGLDESGTLTNPQILISGARWMTSQATVGEVAQLYLDGSLPSA